MDHAFDTLGWDSVIHLIHADNHGSQAVSARLGSANTGQEVEVPGFGILVDIWGQSASEWKGNRTRILAPHG